MKRINQIQNLLNIIKSRCISIILKDLFYEFDIIDS